MECADFPRASCPSEVVRAEAHSNEGRMPALRPRRIRRRLFALLFPKNRDWYERETAEKAFTLTGCVL